MLKGKLSWHLPPQLAENKPLPHENDDKKKTKQE
jgi:hypothetical protein